MSHSLTTSQFDVIVVGAGPVGENVADRAVAGGLSAAVIEEELVGGECSYWACIPSKALLRGPEARRAAALVPGAREAVTGGVDPDAVLGWRTEMVSGWDDGGQVEWLDSAGVALVRGTARITGERHVTVTTGHGSRVLEARHAVVVATGSRAFVPDIPGLREAGPWTNREATEAREVPGSLVVIGGGAVGCELATAYAGLGSRVTMLVRDRLLGDIGDDAHELLAGALRELGVDLRLGAQATEVRRASDGVHATCDDGTTVSAAEVLVATGREPRTDGIGLASVGLPDGGWLPVTESMQVVGADGEVAVPWLYAVGDVNHRQPVTHQGKYQARAAGDAIVARARGEAVDDAPWGRHAATADHGAATQVVFTDPQVATVGRSAAAAREQGKGVREVSVDLAGVAGTALHAPGAKGLVSIVIDDESDVMLGATLVGPAVAEMLHAATIAVVGEVPLHRLWHAVPAFPTMSEVWLRLLEADGRATADR